MINWLRSRGATAAFGAVILALASGEASAQAVPVNVAAAIKATAVDGLAMPLGVRAAPAAHTVSAIYATKAAQSVTVALPAAGAAAAAAAANAASAAAPDIAREAAWLYRNGWPLYALVDRYEATVAAPLSEEASCMATAVYHEARGESLEGQLAVARVIMNRAASGKYPATWCGTVKQPWQFSFVNPRSGQFPYTDTNCEAWRKAVAVTRLAMANAVPSVSTDVLWYHADYVAPSWGRRLTRATQIGTHIFYRS